MKYKAKLGDYELHQKLGSGEYSKVREGIKDGKKYAIKYIKVKNDLRLFKKCNEILQSETKIMNELDHPHIMKLYDLNDKAVIVKENGKVKPVLYLVFELIENGDLFEYISIGERFPEKLARYYFKQLISALEFMHAKGYVHRDIKAENLLMDSEYNIKLADFGLSSPIGGKDGSGTFRTYKGTEGYMATEIISHAHYSGEKADIFAAGILLYIMIAQHPPFRKASICDGLYKLFCGQNELYWKKAVFGKPIDIFSDSFKTLINNLLVREPSKRMIIQQIKESEWYNGEDMSNEEVKVEIDKRKSKLILRSAISDKELSNSTNE